MSMRSIYRKMAKENGVAVAEGKSEMQAAIHAAWNHPSKTAEQTAMQNKIASGSKTPPKADDFIRAMSAH